MSEIQQPAPGRGEGTSPPLFDRQGFLLGLPAALLVAALALAIQNAWTCDDAYISFRYARHLIEGLGLVYNAGQPVEGYTNFLWTTWTALGMLAGFSPELWAHCWSIAAFAGSLAILAFVHRRLRRDLPVSGLTAFPLPVALMLGVIHQDWRHYATSGLETSALTFLLLAALFVATADATVSVRRALFLGLIMGLAYLTRPDAALMAVVLGGFLLFASPARRAPALAYAGALLLLALPHLAWRILYYGEFLPNTYYAKSASIAWYSQGLIYVGTYFRQHWPLLFALLPFWSLRGRLFFPGKRLHPRVSRLLWLCATLTAVHLFYVIRIGGDFMFARMLIPITPFLLILVEIGMAEQPKENRVIKFILLAIFLLSPLFTPRLPTGRQWVSGIVDEHDFYNSERVSGLEWMGSRLAEIGRGLPLRVLFVGEEARVVYRARFPFSLDINGLLDPFTAKLPVSKRGRPGHEKVMPLEYAVSVAKLHLVMRDYVYREELGNYIPNWPFRLDNISGHVLHWDSQVMPELIRRGAEMEDFEAYLDRYLAKGDMVPAETLRADFERFKRFYFDHNRDPVRLRRFEQLLASRTQSEVGDPTGVSDWPVQRIKSSEPVRNDPITSTRKQLSGDPAGPRSAP